MTKDKTVFLLGGVAYGPLYALYDFMEIMFNFDCFDTDSICIDKVTSINLKEIDVIDIPDMESLSWNLSSMWYPADPTNMDNKYYGERMRTNNYSIDHGIPFYQDYNPSNGTYQYGHNSGFVIPRAEFSEEHPKWFSDNGAQLCYTAHGDKEELVAMAEQVVKKTIWALYRNPRSSRPIIDHISFTMEDNYEFCTCEHCLESAEKYNSSGAVMQFANIYAGIFDEWSKGKPIDEVFKYTKCDEEWLDINIGEENRKEYIREDFYFGILIYNNQLIAPAKKDASTGKYVPIDESCMVAENVRICLADIEMDWSQSYFSEANEESYENILAWAELIKNCKYGMKFYNYPEYPNRPFWFYDGFNATSKEAISLMLNCSATELFNCGASVEGSPRLSGFKSYFSYLQCKLAWNVNQSVEELTEKYFKNNYGEAADVMLNLFNEERNYFHYQYEKNGMYQKNSIYNTPYNAKFWDKNVMKKWIDDCYTAFALIEKSKEADPQGYELKYSHIAAEMIYPSSVYLQYFKTEISQEEKLSLTSRLLNDYYQMGLNDKTMWYPYGKTPYLSTIQGWAM